MAPCPAHTPRGTDLPGQGPAPAPPQGPGCRLPDWPALLCPPPGTLFTFTGSCIERKPSSGKMAPPTVPSGVLQPPQTTLSGFLKVEPPSGTTPASSQC